MTVLVRKWDNHSHSSDPKITEADKDPEKSKAASVLAVPSPLLVSVRPRKGGREFFPSLAVESLS